MTLHYFAEDGNYGDASNLEVLDTSNWTQDEWQEVEEASDSTRVYIAAYIANKAKDVVKDGKL